MSLFSTKFSVNRSIQIDREVSEVFQLVVNFSEMKKWSPWMVMEPSAKTTLEGADGIVGAVHGWEGDLLGAGELEITSIAPNRAIDYDLRFFKPWKSASKVRFEFEDLEGTTKVTWTMDSRLPWFMFWMTSMMEEFVGMDYVRGLTMLKEYCETGEVLSLVEIEDARKFDGFNYIGVKKTCSLDAIGESMKADFEKLEAYMNEHQIHTSGTVFSIYHKYDFKAKICTYTSGFSVKSPRDAAEDFVAGRLFGGKALVLKHTGRYENLGNAWTAGYAYLRSKKIKPKKGVDPLEVYLNNPKETDPKDLKTVLFFPVKENGGKS